NRDAFSQIVSRYQSLVCSLAYSATGSLGQSEDIAQDTFIAAWKQLRSLDEPEKLRAWLCGIARNLTNNSLRKQGREPSHRAESLDEIAESQSPEPLPVDRTISNEEAEILWRSLERIPEIYREPLVLFYREHQSVETVAANLDLTEDAVKQRLSRGRKLLQDQVIAFIEGALSRTAPDRTFTLNVMAALPAAASAKAATLGAAIKGGSTAKAAGVMGIIGAILGPLMIIFGNYVGYRIGMEEARSDEERGMIKQSFKKVLLWAGGLSIITTTLLVWQRLPHLSPWALCDIAFLNFAVLYITAMLVFIVTSRAQRHSFYSRILHEEYGGVFPEAAWEYRSRTTLFGLPLVHIRVGDRFDLLRGPVKAWIAAGNYSVGGLFAFGGVAIAPFSMGFLAVGLLPYSAIAIGVAAMGGIAIGPWAWGALTIGWESLGGIAIGWKAAVGFVAIAHDFAQGGISHAIQANNAVADQFIQSNWFFRAGHLVARYSLLINLLWILPLVAQQQIIARKNNKA
ncbi:MAG TPA: sigma-70 family RNA polymerase sigma factor, partial [Desulfuromonadaceae bacterium]|nr:sigma-70 family RNA polymerase sigma factor [Desulfuromonadaceae bacterium]